MRNNWEIPDICGLCAVAFLCLSACGGGGGGAPPPPPPPPPVISFEIQDPTPGEADAFGETIAVLPNGNVVVTDPADSSIADGNGAVHLFDPVTQSLIGSIHGDSAFDHIGETAILVLENGNYVVTSHRDNNGNIVQAGSVKLVSGTTGEQIGDATIGTESEDRIGSFGTIALANGNYIVVSPSDDVDGMKDAGSVRLIV